jgi:beta-phosphoglucomutase-like phosphatase (HAD superfamily)
MSGALAQVRTLLLDADGNLFPSEEPAFEASTVVTNRLLERLGSSQRFTPDELRKRAVGKNFRATATELAAAEGVSLDGELDDWVAQERDAVVAHLGTVLRPDVQVSGPLEALAMRYALTVVSSSALARLDACFRATQLDTLLPAEVRYSAEDSLPEPTSKPDPAVYAHAGRELGVEGGEALAVEDAASGVVSAVCAGFPVVGNLLFVPEDEREERAAALTAAGALAIVGSWHELDALLADAVA